MCDGLHNIPPGTSVRGRVSVQTLIGPHSTSLHYRQRAGKWNQRAPPCQNLSTGSLGDFQLLFPSLAISSLFSDASSHLSLLFPRLLLWAEGTILPQGSSQARAFGMSGAPQQTLWHVVEKAMATHLCRLSQGQNCQLNSGALLTN